MTTLRTAFGRYKHTEHLHPTLFQLQDAGIAPISRAFAPMVREAKFDASEMALGTALLAREFGTPLVLLPVIMTARFQQRALLCRDDGPVDAPEALRGRRVGVRAYTQTTAIWLRGILAESHGLQPQDIAWITFEDAHVPGFQDPAWATRAPAGSDTLSMLRDGTLDAAIFGNEVPDEPWLRCVFPDPAASEQDFQRRHGFMPVNHIAVVQARLAAEHPDWVHELIRLLGGPHAIDPAAQLMATYMVQQSMLTAAPTPGEIWAGLP